jgi:hypothetical protein
MIDLLPLPESIETLKARGFADMIGNPALTFDDSVNGRISSKIVIHGMAGSFQTVSICQQSGCVALLPGQRCSLFA